MFDVIIVSISKTASSPAFWILSYSSQVGRRMNGTTPAARLFSPSVTN